MCVCVCVCEWCVCVCVCVSVCVSGVFVCTRGSRDNGPPTRVGRESPKGLSWWVSHPNTGETQSTPALHTKPHDNDQGMVASTDSRTHPVLREPQVCSDVRSDRDVRFLADPLVSPK